MNKKMAKNIFDELLRACLKIIYFNQETLGSVDNSSSEALPPATCSRDPGILINTKTNYFDSNHSGSREQVAGRRKMKCQQTIVSIIFISATINLAYALEQDNIPLSSSTEFINQIDSPSKDSSNEPLELKATSADINQSTHIGTYTGGIEFDQGNTHIRADKATTRTDENNKLIAAVIYGNAKSQAHYWSQPDNNKPCLHAYADIIEYYPVKKIIKLIGNARIEQGKNQFTAAEIIYNIEKRHIVSNSTQKNKQKTVIIFYPARKS